MAKKLTTRFIENVRPLPKRKEYPDGGNGLYLVVQATTAVKSFAGRYRYLGKSKKLTLGRWPAVTLAAARRDWATALHGLAQGCDPAAAREGAKLKAAAAQADTVVAVCEEYLKREGKRLRTADQRVSILQRLVYPAIGDRPVGDLKRSEIVRLMDKIEDASGQRMADVTLAVLRRILFWHAARTDDFVPPFVRGMARQRAAEHRRSRILDDDELRRLWIATADGQPFSSFIRFLLLSTARRGEAAGLKRSEVDANGIWTLPAARSKSKLEIIRPLSGAAQEVLAAQPRVGDYVFATGGPLRNFSGPKRKLDVVSGVRDWHLHDLRRTSRSLLSRSGIAPDVAERCLGHALPTIRATYDRHRYVDEMAHAFEALAALIERIVNPTDAVLAFRR
jgi:integrase